MAVSGETHESSVFLARAPDKVAQVQASCKRIWAVSLRVCIKAIYKVFVAPSLTPSSVSGSRPIAFYRLCFNCRVNIWVRAIQNRRYWAARLLLWNRDKDSHVHYIWIIALCDIIHYNIKAQGWILVNLEKRSNNLHIYKRLNNCQTVY